MSVSGDDTEYKWTVNDVRALDTKLNNIHSDLKTNTGISEKALEQAKRTNGRVNEHDKQIHQLQNTVLKRTRIELPPPDSKFWVILAVTVVILVLFIIGRLDLIERALNVFL